MAKIIQLSVFLAIAIFFISTISAMADNNSQLQIDKIMNMANSPELDGREIKKLEWRAPPGALPGQYAEYLEKHPIISPEFHTVISSHNKAGENFAILVDATLYSSITTSITQYITDLETEGHAVLVHTVSGGSPQDIKDWVIDRFSEGCQGFVFIGDVTAAWAEVSGSQFPCDLFYMDIDGNWEDNNLDGIYEVHTAGSGDMAPEIYIGRIYAHSLTYDTETNMVNDYFYKTINYRNGILTQPWRGLEYIDEDWYYMPVNLDLVYDDSLSRYDYGYFTTGADYLDNLDLGQYFTTVCAHSFTGGHHFGTRPTESAAYGHIYVYSPTTRSAKLLMASDEGLRVWLNGALEFSNEGYGEWIDDMYSIDITLQSGWNRLLCKASQSGIVYYFSARFTDMWNNTFPDLEYRLNDPDLYPAEGEFIQSWLINGFHEDVSGNFWYYLTTNYLGEDEASINPIEGQIMGGETWTTVNQGYPFIDFSEYDDQDFGAYYAFVRVNSSTTQDCQLWLGYDDGCRAWLNGVEVLYDNVNSGFEADLSKTDVTLNAGENRLLVKISEWMGGHGFSARFCQSDGGLVNGLTYDPTPVPIEHIGAWLVNGPYLNTDESSRLTIDYLGGEDSIRPNQDDAAPFGVWERAIGNGRPFNLGLFYDRGGDWVFSSTVQERDPPSLFYNLFSCGPGRFTDEDYLAGSYIYNTSTGLITIASAKSGSMLNFQDFTAPLSENKSIGQAYLEWFQTQAPFDLWEQEWYYGMVLNGDPTLHLSVCVDSDGDGYGDPGYQDSPCLEDNCPDDYNPTQEDICSYICGDANSDGAANILDITFLISYLYANGPAPDPFESADVNSDSLVNILDISYQIAYLYMGGPEPICL